jgi:transcriptional regulator with XRE-family HTH domain
MTFREIFISNLKDLRKNRKISQGKLAELCDSNQQYIASIESGKQFPSPAMIERISRALGIESYYLFQRKNADGRTLTHLQRQEITERLHEAVSKIVNQY